MDAASGFMSRSALTPRNRSAPTLNFPNGPRIVVIEAMVTVRMSEAEVIKDIPAVLAKVRQGVEIIVEQNNQTIAVIKPPHRSGRPISEVLREAKRRNSTVTLDEEFSKDLEEIIATRQGGRTFAISSDSGRISPRHLSSENNRSWTTPPSIRGESN